MREENPVSSSRERNPSTAWTPNFESDADFVAPVLAALGGVAGALYYWLHSRAFAASNSARLSVGFLADQLGVNPSSVKYAIDQLKHAGLIRVTTKRGSGGYTEIGLVHLRKPQRQMDNKPSIESGGSPPLNRAISPYDINNNTNKVYVTGTEGDGGGGGGRESNGDRPLSASEIGGMESRPNSQSPHHSTQPRQNRRIRNDKTRGTLEQQPDARFARFARFA